MMVDDPVTMAEYLRIDHRYLDGTMTGGSSFEFHVQHLAAAIQEGLCDVALVTYGSDQLTKMGRKLGTGGFQRGGQKVAGPMQYEVPYGGSLVGSYAMYAQRHMHEFGTTSEQLAEIAVGVREFAALNPNAIYRDPITVDDVVDSRMIADPLHMLDCCAITDGGGALIMTTAERAKDLEQPPVYVLGAAGAQTHWNISPADRLHDVGRRARGAGRVRAGRRHARRHRPADVLRLFTITCLILLESLGFVPQGEGGPFVAEGHLKKGGKWPLNTDGGGLSSCHPGMRGIFLLIESVRQLRGQGGDAQVPDCELAIAAGSGGWLSCIGVVIIGSEHP